jgi:hypothetical protein
MSRFSASFAPFPKLALGAAAALAAIGLSPGTARASMVTVNGVQCDVTTFTGKMFYRIQILIALVGSTLWPMVVRCLGGEIGPLRSSLPRPSAIVVNDFGGVNEGGSMGPWFGYQRNSLAGPFRTALVLRHQRLQRFGPRRWGS